MPAPKATPSKVISEAMVEPFYMTGSRLCKTSSD